MTNIMNKTQQPVVTHKSILHEICKHLLTLVTENLNKIIELADHPYLAPAYKPGGWLRDCGN